MPASNPQTNLIYFIPLLSRRSFNMPIERESVSQRNIERTVSSQCRRGKIAIQILVPFYLLSFNVNRSAEIKFVDESVCANGKKRVNVVKR